jgi:hypothetical protein
MIIKIYPDELAGDGTKILAYDYPNRAMAEVELKFLHEDYPGDQFQIVEYRE